MLVATRWSHTAGKRHSVNSVSMSFLLRDVRGPIYVLISYAATVYMYRETDARPALRTLSDVLWVTAALVTAESILGLYVLAGRVEVVDRVEAALSGVNGG